MDDDNDSAGRVDCDAAVVEEIDASRSLDRGFPAAAAKERVDLAIRIESANGEQKLAAALGHIVEPVTRIRPLASKVSVSIKSVPGVGVMTTEPVPWKPMSRLPSESLSRAAQPSKPRCFRR